MAADALSPLDARVLRATDSKRIRSPGQVASRAGVREDVALSCLRRLRVRENQSGQQQAERQAAA